MIPALQVRADRTVARAPAARDAAAVEAQAAAFDYDTAERAELLREHQALEALMQAQLKNEDEIMKKWIAMI